MSSGSKMKILTFPLGQLQANCYFVVNDKDCLIIDPADEAPFILEELQRRNFRLTGMLVTHGHFDHVMAAGEIQLSFPVPLYINSKDLFLIRRLKETAKHFLHYDPAVIEPTIIKNLENENSLKIKNFKLKIISTIGHTPGSVSYFFPGEKAVFTGDTLFRQAIGRTDLSYSSGEELAKSLVKLFQLPSDVSVYPGHGSVTTIGQEAALFHF